MDPKRKGPDLAIIFGGKPGKPSSKPGSDSEDRDRPDDDTDDEHDDLPPGFEAAAIEAFPDFEGDHERLAALKRLISLCMDSYE